MRPVLFCPLRKQRYSVFSFANLEDQKTHRLTCFVKPYPVVIDSIYKQFLSFSQLSKVINALKLLFGSSFAYKLRSLAKNLFAFAVVDSLLADLVNQQSSGYIPCTLCTLYPSNNLHTTFHLSLLKSLATYVFIRGLRDVYKLQVNTREKCGGVHE